MDKRPETFDIEQATKDDYISSPAAYEYLYALRDDPFTHQMQLEQMAVAAKKVGVSNFKTLYKKYVDQVRSMSAKVVGLSTNFDGQTLELQTGPWQADDTGVYREGEFQTVYACHHPVMPVERLINIDSNTEKLKIAFRPGRAWRTLIADKSTLASTQQIIGLADFGLSVSSETAKHLVKYLQDIEQLNYDMIPERRSVARLGWISEGEFSPYVPEIVFDGEVNFRPMFEAITSAGSRDEWVQHVSALRRQSLAARIVLAASFASVLVKPCGSLPFFVHLWSTASGSGKTVALMMAASVWANPHVGSYIQTFNSTTVNRERVADFLNSMPMIIDELQLHQGNKGTKRFDPYLLAEGSGKGRGTKQGGIERQTQWALCVLTAGETPMVGLSDGAGAINRVIDIEVGESEKIIPDGHTTANFVRANYGHVGREFVERLNKFGFAEAQKMYQENMKIMMKSDATDKQIMAAALIVTADQLATDWIFQDDANVTIQEIDSFLSKQSDISMPIRAYEYACDWVAQNTARFTETQSGETYGAIENGTAYIISTVFHKAMEEAGYSGRAVLSWLNTNKLIETNKGRNTILKRLSSFPVRCVALKLPSDYEETMMPYDL